MAERFSLRILYLLRRTYGLEDRHTRLRRQGLLTLDEVSELLGADPSTVKIWARDGHIPSQVYNAKGARMYERPASLQQSCQWCGGPIPAKPFPSSGEEVVQPALLHGRLRQPETRATSSPAGGRRVIGAKSLSDRMHELNANAIR